MSKQFSLVIHEHVFAVYRFFEVELAVQGPYTKSFNVSYVNYSTNLILSCIPDTSSPKLVAFGLFHCIIIHALCEFIMTLLERETLNLMIKSFTGSFGVVFSIMHIGFIVEPVDDYIDDMVDIDDIDARLQRIQAMMKQGI